MYIYLITNLINNKKYVGLCSRSALESKKYYGSGSNISKALKKYGKHNFTKSILEECKTIDELKAAEKYWIDKFNAVNSNMFYNVESGGNDIHWNYLDDSQKLAMKQKISDKTKEAMSRISKDIFKKSAQSNKNNTKQRNFEMFDEAADDIEKLITYSRRTYFKEWLKNNPSIDYLIKKRTSSLISSARIKKCYMFDFNKSLIKEFSSLDDAIKYVNGKSKGNISMACQGKRESAYGYKWSYTKQIK